MRIRSKVMAAVGTVVLTSAVVVMVGASPAMASGQYCTSTNDFTVCQQVNGAGTVINWAKGVVTPKYAVGYPWEITMTGITGGTICQENFSAATSTAQSCYWSGGNREYNKGNICTAVDINGGVEGWVADGKACLYVS